MAIDSNELSGQVLGTCTLHRLLGRGGMGVVYLARQSRPRRTVAVKVLVPSMHTDPKERAEFLVRFRREADAIAALDHINIMPIYEYGELAELAYLVMPYVTGGTLRTLLDKKSILSLEEIVPIIEQAAAALDCAHAQGIVHRDLKPGNILFHADGRVVLADFGLAKVLRGNEDRDSSDGLSTLTSIGTIIGTPEYLSPEQSTGQPIGPYTDIYALGIVLYQMLSGHVPFTGSSPVAVALKHTLEMPPPLLPFNPTLPPTIEAITMKALAKKPQERFQSAGDFARELHIAAFGTPPAKNQLQHAILENIATITIPDEQSEQAMNALADLPTAERPRVSPYADAFPDHSLAPMEEASDVTMAHDLQNPSSNQPQLSFAEAPFLPSYQARAHIHTEAPELHESETVETPQPLLFEAPTPSAHQAPPVIVPPARKPPAVASARQAQTMPVPERFTDKPGPVQTRKHPSIQMVILGTLVALLLIVGGFIVYLNLTPKGQSQPVHATSTRSIAKATLKPQPFTAPAPLIQASSVLYGTALPGTTCDTQGGQWSVQAGAQVTCTSNSTQLTNTGDNLAGIFLNKLPHGQGIPVDYVLQVQVTISPSDQGQLGIFLRNQPGTPTRAEAFLLSADGTLTRNEYSGQAGTPLLRSYQLGKIAETVTLDVSVHADTYKFYINGIFEGGTQSTLYSDGNLGLVVAPGTTLSCKNLVIYAF